MASIGIVRNVGLVEKLSVGMHAFVSFLRIKSQALDPYFALFCLFVCFPYMTLID